jgi:hypothetical protein
MFYRSAFLIYNKEFNFLLEIEIGKTKTDLKASLKLSVVDDITTTEKLQRL